MAAVLASLAQAIFLLALAALALDTNERGAAIDGFVALSVLELTGGLAAWFLPGRDKANDQRDQKQKGEALHVALYVYGFTSLVKSVLEELASGREKPIRAFGDPSDE